MACPERTDKMDAPYQSTAGYLHRAFEDIDGIIRDAEKALEGVDYDTMVGTGLSGSLVIPTLARALGKYWCIVRKDEQNHSNRRIEGQIGHKWVFVDDIIDTGKTRERVKSAMEEEFLGYRRHSTQYVGTFTYYWGSSFSM